MPTLPRRAEGTRRRGRSAPAGEIIGLALLGLLVLAAAAAPLLTRALGIDPAAVDLLQRFAPPSPAHPLGTDELGRDLFARLLEGGRVSIAVGLTAALTASLLGTAIGLAAGFYGGRLDALLMRLTDFVLALPLLPLLIVLVAVDLGKIGLGPDRIASDDAAIVRLVLVIGATGWTTVARLVRAATQQQRELDYVRAAQVAGAGHRRILLVHILPNIASPILVATTLAIGNMVLVESTLSFLGLGIQPPRASWGNMLSNAEDLMTSAPMLAVWPGLCIFLTVLATNLVGDAFNRRLARRA